MKEFLNLKLRAKENRDNALEAVYAEYEAALIQIATLEQALLRRVAKMPKCVAACIDSVIPRTDTFTYLDKGFR